MNADVCIQVKKQFPHLGIDASLSLAAGKVSALLGASGSGKTTLLRILAGLEKPDSGRIRLGDKHWYDSEARINLPVQKRRVGFMFQDYALFDHLTVAQNIVYAVAKDQKQVQLAHWLQRLQLQDCADKYPHQLSGGQKQRVALGRALALQPSVLLLDEPLSALDYSLRKSLRRSLKQYIADLDIPVVLVTHDLDEARELADQIYVLDQGRLVAAGKVNEVINHPGNFIAARTLGWRNFLKVEHIEQNRLSGAWGSYNSDGCADEHIRYLAFQAQHGRIYSREAASGIPCRVLSVHEYGSYREIELQCNDGSLLLVHRFWDEPVPGPGSEVHLCVSSLHMQLLTEHCQSSDQWQLSCTPLYQPLSQHG